MFIERLSAMSYCRGTEEQELFRAGMVVVRCSGEGDDRPLLRADARSCQPRPACGEEVVLPRRHCEERSDEAIHFCRARALDCFASLAMTVTTTSRIQETT